MYIQIEENEFKWLNDFFKIDITEYLILKYMVIKCNKTGFSAFQNNDFENLFRISKSTAQRKIKHLESINLIKEKRTYKEKGFFVVVVSQNWIYYKIVQARNEYTDMYTFKDYLREINETDKILNELEIKWKK